MADNPMTYDLAPLRRILDEYGGQKGAVIPILQHVQEAYGYLPKELLAEISKRTGIPLTRLIGVATFYAQFRLARRGKHLIRVCDGTACHVRARPRTWKPSKTRSLSAMMAPHRTTNTPWKSSIASAHAAWRRWLWLTTGFSAAWSRTSWSSGCAGEREVDPTES